MSCRNTRTSWMGGQSQMRNDKIITKFDLVGLTVTGE